MQCLKCTVPCTQQPCKSSKEPLGSTGNVGARYRCIQSVYSQPRPIITRRLQDLGPNDGIRCGFRARNPVDLLRCQCNAAMHIALESQSAKGLGLHLAQAGGGGIVMCAGGRVTVLTGKSNRVCWVPWQSRIAPTTCLVSFFGRAR